MNNSCWSLDKLIYCLWTAIARTQDNTVCGLELDCKMKLAGSKLGQHIEMMNG